MTGASPTVRQRELGLRLRKLRNDLDLTVEDVAEKLMCSAAKVSRMETGARRPVLRDVRDLCKLYGVDEAATAELMKLTREAREQGWWTQYEDLNLYPYIGLEQNASAITCYAQNYFPGLLQTGDYATTLIKGVLPRIDPAVHQQRVEARLRRQQSLEGSNPPRYRALIDEAVLRRPVGGAAVMATQLDKILMLIHAATVIIQVIPLTAGARAGADSNFVLLEFSEPFLTPVVYVEGAVSGQYYERAVDVAHYREIIKHLRDSALNTRDSVRLLTETQRAYAGG